MIQPVSAQRPAVPAKVKGNWIQEMEHWIVRGGSLALSIVSGHAVYWLFSAMDGVDVIEPYMTWLTAVAIGLLGYVILRALTHRLLHGEKIRMYVPICFILIMVETIANFTKAIVGVHDDKWLSYCPTFLVGFMTVMTYVVLSVMPAFTVFLAYVDMDLERAATRGSSHVTSKTAVSPAALKGGPVPLAMPKPGPQAGPAMPKTIPSNQFPTQQFAPIASYPTAVAQGGQSMNYGQSLPAPTQATTSMPLQPSYPQAAPPPVFGGRMNNVGRNVANGQPLQPQTP